MGWQWHQLDHMQIICTSVQTDNPASTSPLSFYRPDALASVFTGRMPLLPPNQQRQSTEGKFCIVHHIVWPRVTNRRISISQLLSL